VWRTDDAGVSWRPLTDSECSLAMGSIAIDPVNPEIIYAGTGEQHFSGDSYYGCGVLRSKPGDPARLYAALRRGRRDARDMPVIYRSMDGGVSWISVSPTFPGNAEVGRINLGTLRLYLSEDGGRTFREAHPRGTYVDQHLMVFDTLTGPDVLYLAIVPLISVDSSLATHPGSGREEALDVSVVGFSDLPGPSWPCAAEPRSP